jgi:hypothetical protein
MRLTAIGILVIVLAGCSVAIRTEERPTDVCAMARVGGVLVADPVWGVGLANEGPSRGVVWPAGYSARWDLDGVVLLGPGGGIVAREGDTIASAGHASDDGVSHPCGNIRVVQEELADGAGQ